MRTYQTIAMRLFLLLGLFWCVGCTLKEDVFRYLNERDERAFKRERVPFKDPSQRLNLNDENLMYLNGEVDYGARPWRKSPSGREKDLEESRNEEMQRLWGENNDSEREKAMRDRISLDMVENKRGGKKRSFFREREVANLENFQNLYEPEVLFRPKFPHYVRTVEGDDYLRALNYLWYKYKESPIRDVDPATLSDEEVREFMRYLEDSETEPEEQAKKSHVKRYWLGTERLRMKRAPGWNKRVEKMKQKLWEKWREGDKISSPTLLKRSKKIDWTATGRSKRSIDWSKYFGVDKKSEDQQDGIYKDSQPVYGDGKMSYDTPLETYQAALDDEESGMTMDSRDEELKLAEDAILDDVLKYATSKTEDEDLKEVEDKIMTQLGAAYRLEKLRHDLRTAMKDRGEREGNKMSNEKEEGEGYQKRFSVKKESVTDDEGGEHWNVTEFKYRTKNMDDKAKDRLQKIKNYYKGKVLEDCPDFDKMFRECAVMIEDARKVPTYAQGYVDLRKFTEGCIFYQLCLVCGKTDEYCDRQFVYSTVTCPDAFPVCMKKHKALMNIMFYYKNELKEKECKSCMTSSFVKLTSE